MMIEINGLHVSVITESQGEYHRMTLAPGDSLIGQPQEVIDAATALWTPQAMAQWAADHPVPTQAETLAAWRAAAFMTKANFLKALKAAQILTAQEAIAAAKGEVPASFATMVAALPQADQDAAQIEWGAASNITRNNQFIGLVAAARVPPILPEALDAIFGWTE